MTAGAIAYGGGGGTGATGGLGGAAKATATADARLSTGTAAANATALAETANGQVATGAATVNGGSGTAGATAITSGGIIAGLTATASAPDHGQTKAASIAAEGTAYTAASGAGDNSYARTGGLAAYSGLGPNVGAVFNKSGPVNFGTGALGANGDAVAATYTSAISWVVPSGDLPAGGNLDLGLVNAMTAGSGFTSLKFTCTENGTAKITQTFTSVAAANTYFTDDLKNLVSGRPVVAI